MPSPLLQQRLGPGHAFAEALHGVFVVVQPFMDTRYRQAAIINVDELHLCLFNSDKSDETPRTSSLSVRKT